MWHETIGNAARVFGRPDEAIVSFERMRTIAEAYGLNEFILRADRALDEISSFAPLREEPSPSRVDEQPADVVAVAHAMTAMREHCGVNE